MPSAIFASISPSHLRPDGHASHRSAPLQGAVFYSRWTDGWSTANADIFLADSVSRAGRIRCVDDRFLRELYLS
jgi:hypothetical protein